MSLLPQRKKSAEELTKLRESLGVPGPPPGMMDTPPHPPQVRLQEVDEEPIAAVLIPEAEPGEAPRPLSPIPVPGSSQNKQVRSLKRGERVSELPVDSPPSQASPVISGVLQPPQAEPKIVKSLKKSEQAPLPSPQQVMPSPDSKLPVQRRSAKELNDIRRREAIAIQMNMPQPPKMIAHLALVIPGYALMLAGWLAFYYYELAIEIPASCVGVGLLIAAFILIKRPLSRHHAAFLSVMAMLVIVFGALHYFPQLRYGS